MKWVEIAWSKHNWFFYERVFHKSSIEQFIKLIHRRGEHHSAVIIYVRFQQIDEREREREQPIFNRNHTHESFWFCFSILRLALDFLQPFFSLLILHAEIPFTRSLRDCDFSFSLFCARVHSIWVTVRKYILSWKTIMWNLCWHKGRLNYCKHTKMNDRMRKCTELCSFYVCCSKRSFTTKLHPWLRMYTHARGTHTCRRRRHVRSEAC